MRMRAGTLMLATSAGLSLTACGVSGDEAARNCHAGIEDEIREAGFNTSFDYVGDSVTENPETGAYTAEGMAFIQNPEGRLWFTCVLDSDGNYLSSTWNVL